MMLSTINLTVILETLIFGIVASSIVAIAVELWKKSCKRYHISVTLDSCEVYVSQEKSDVMIKVDYKGRAVENALVVMYVCFTNDGQNDIRFKSHFSDAIALKCEGYDFLSFTAEESRVEPKCFLNEDGPALLSWDILKAGETIRLCIAAHSNISVKEGLDGVECFNKLSFDFRSDCIDNLVPSKEMTQREIRRKRIFNVNLTKNVLFIIVSLWMLLYDMSFSSRYDIVYDGQTYGNATLFYSPLFRKYILSSDTARTKILSLAETEGITAMFPTDYVNAASRMSAILEVMILMMIFVSIISIVTNLLAFSLSSRKRHSLKKRSEAS